MFRGLLNDAKSAVSSVVMKYLARASVAVPFVIAAGFAIAAVTLMLVEQFGHVAAYWIMAGGLAVVGAIAAVVVSVKEQEEEAAESAAAAAEPQSVASTATAAVAEAAVQAPVAALGLLSALPLSPGALIPAVRALLRNYPLVILGALVVLLLWPSETAAAQEEEVRPSDVEPGEEEKRHVRLGNGADPLPSEMRH